MGRAGWIHCLCLPFGKSREEPQQIVTDTHKVDQVASLNSTGGQLRVVRDSKRLCARSNARNVEF